MTRATVGRRVAGVLALATIVAASLVGTGIAAAGPPRGVHIAFGADPRTSATVTWFTSGATDPGTIVEYGTDETLGLSASGTSQKAPGNGYPSGTVLVHEVLLQNLAPGSTVYYRAGSPSGWSPVRSFETAPATGSSFTFTAFADHGVEEESRHTTAAVIEEAPDFHVIAGDLSYAQPSTPTFPEFHKWDTWFDEIEPLAATTPLMIAPGNHECESIGCSASFRARLALPGQELFYSFDYLNAHFAVFLSDNATTTQERRADAFAFLEQDLAEASQRKSDGEIDWIFVVQHHPLYGSQTGEPQAELLERKYNPRLIALEERMLHAYDVDVLITGHNHHYQRSKPMVAGQPTSNDPSSYTDPVGFIQVITGGGGEGLRSLSQPDDLPDWSASAARRFHYTRFEIDGKTLRASAIATDGLPNPTIDSWTLTRS